MLNQILFAYHQFFFFSSVNGTKTSLSKSPKTCNLKNCSKTKKFKLLMMAIFQISYIYIYLHWNIQLEVLYNSAMFDFQNLTSCPNFKRESHKSENFPPQKSTNMQQNIYVYILHLCKILQNKYGWSRPGGLFWG